MLNRRSLRVGAVLAAMAVMTVQAVGSVFYGVNTSGMISRFDMTAQTVTQLTNIHAGPTTPTGFQDLEYDNAGQLWAVRCYTDFNTFQGFNEFYRITNVNTGTSLLGGSYTAGGLPYQPLAFRNSNSSFYTVNAMNGYVGTIDVHTAAFNPVSGATHGLNYFVQALAVNPVDGQAYGLIDMGIPIFGTIDMTLIRTNLDTGVSTIVGSMGMTSDYFTALRFDETGTAYTVANTTGNVYTVNTTTGASSFLFAGGAAAQFVNGLALVVPAPASAGLLLVGGAVLARRRRR